MTLTDAGPLVALVDRHDQHHARCAAALPAIELPLLTTQAALTEAMYFLGGRLGWHSQRGLWDMYRSGRLVISPMDSVMTRMEELMAKYFDVPMDFADASLVAVAEDRELFSIFSTDDHFRIYRLHGRQPFDLIPL